MNTPKLNPDTQRIKTHKAMIQYQRAMAAKKPREGDTPLGESPLNRDGMPKIPPGQQATDRWLEDRYSK